MYSSRVVASSVYQNPYKKRIPFYGLLLLITVSISVVSPFVWKANFSGYLPVFFSNYLNPLHGSLFPLFPWLFFLFAGAFFSKLYINSRVRTSERDFIKKLFLYGSILVISGHLMFSDFFSSPFLSIRPNPLFLYLRLGYVFILASFFWYYEYKRQTKHSFVLDISRESLLIYWLHLEIIFSKIWNGKSLEQLAAGSFTWLECFAGTLLLIFLMIFVAIFWGRFKKRYPEYPRTVTSMVIILTIIVLMIR